LSGTGPAGDAIPQITAKSTGTGDAGSITISAVRLLTNNNAAISTEAEVSTANARNITLEVRDLLYLLNSKITTSVKNSGSGGNITIDTKVVVLNHGSITAQAVEGLGGDIMINAGEYFPSQHIMINAGEYFPATDSRISATSQLGISGPVVISSGPRVDVNGALVVLSSELRRAAEVVRETCAAQGGRPQSSLVEAGRGGLPLDPEATLPALYIAGRDVSPNPQAVEASIEASGALQTTAHLRMRCG
jgi:hypothetical protein